MPKLKRVIVDDTEVEVKDVDPIERMRNRDTDGDGVADYIDSNGYSKPSDRYRYKDISSDEYRKLESNGFDVKNNCRPSKSNPDRHILRYQESQAAEVDRILKPVLHRSVSK